MTWLDCLSVKKGCRGHWNAGLDSRIMYLDQHKNFMATGYICLLELKTGRCWTRRKSSWAGGVFCSLQCWTISLCSSRRHSNTWEKLKAVTDYWILLSCRFFQMLPSHPGINQRTWLQSGVGSCQKEPLAALGEGVLTTVCSLCIKLYTGIQDLSSFWRLLEGGLWPAKCLQSENYIFLVSICFQKVKLWLFISFIFRACSWFWLWVFFFSSRHSFKYSFYYYSKRVLLNFSSLKVYYQSSF